MFKNLNEQEILYIKQSVIIIDAFKNIRPALSDIEGAGLSIINKQLKVLFDNLEDLSFISLEFAVLDLSKYSDIDSKCFNKDMLERINNYNTVNYGEKDCIDEMRTNVDFEEEVESIYSSYAYLNSSMEYYHEYMGQLKYVFQEYLYINTIFEKEYDYYLECSEDKFDENKCSNCESEYCNYMLNSKDDNEALELIKNHIPPKDKIFCDEVALVISKQSLVNTKTFELALEDIFKRNVLCINLSDKIVLIINKSYLLCYVDIIYLLFAFNIRQKDGEACFV